MRKNSRTGKRKKQWDTLFDYEITYHFKNDAIPQSRFFKVGTSDVALNSFKYSMKNKVNEIIIDEFAKHNPYSNQKEILDIPKNII